MALYVGQRVRIAPDYPNTAFQGKRGKIVSAPDRKHRAEYLVQVEDRRDVKSGWIHVDSQQRD
jgi:hypothetical protein